MAQEQAGQTSGGNVETNGGRFTGRDDHSKTTGDIIAEKVHVGDEYHYHLPTPDAGPQAPERIFHVPLPQNPNFTGRQDLLTNLRNTLTAQHTAALVQAIHGLGGVGKTQLALEYAYRHREAYQVVWWLAAEQTATLAADLTALAKALKLEGWDDPNQPAVVALTLAWLAANDGWLLIYDNALNPDGVKAYLPKGGRGHVLLTSRHAHWRGVAAPLPVKVLPQAEAVALLLKRSGREQTSEGEQQAAGDVAEALGRLPLALAQAGAYLEQYATLGFAAYLERFRQRRRTLWQKEPPPDDYPKTAATTWALAMEEVAQTPGAADALNLCAFLGAEAIPLWLLRGAFEEEALEEAVAALHNYSLVEAATETLTVHRLVQAVTQDRLAAEEQKAWAEAAVRLVYQKFPIQNEIYLDSWSQANELLPHGIVATEQAIKLSVASEYTVSVLNEMGLYLYDKGDYIQARRLGERALQSAVRAGVSGTNLASVFNNFGGILWATGDFENALAAFREALKLDIEEFGPDHPNVASDWHHIGSVLHSLGDYPEARNAFEKAIAIQAATPEENTLNHAKTLNDFAVLLRDLGDFPAARQYLELVLAFFERQLGLDHPYTVTLQSNLSLVLQDLGDLPAARLHFERVLTILDKSLGQEHPYYASTLNNLGLVLQALGDLPAARLHYERALAIDERVLGPDHPTVATLLNNLGGVLQALGDLPAARQHFERALAIDEQAFGLDHPQVAIFANNLGRVLQDLGDLPAARQHIERALAIFVRVLGPDHPNTKLVRGNLEEMNKEQGTRNKEQ